MLLRNFSVDKDKKYFNIHLLNNNEFFYNMPLYNQAQENNLYGSDQKLEHFFCQLESTASIGFAKLKTGNSNLLKEEELHIKLFLINQIGRTPGTISSHDDSIELMIKNLASHDKVLKDHLEEFSVGLNDPYKLMLTFSIDLLYTILDLRIGLLETDKKNSFFMIGQNPVILLNPYLREKNWKWSTRGLALKGLIIIMPISPQFSLILYDDLRYKLINKYPKWIIGSSDVDKLNNFQYCNTDDCIYFYNSINEMKYRQINNIYKNIEMILKAILKFLVH
jgi:hypothetical protein